MSISIDCNLGEIFQREIFLRQRAEDGKEKQKEKKDAMFKYTHEAGVKGGQMPFLVLHFRKEFSFRPDVLNARSTSYVRHFCDHKFLYPLCGGK